MSEILPDDVRALREALEASPEDVTVTLSLTRKSAETTRWNDNDQYGHMNNATYFEYIDTAVNGWLMQETGVDIRDLPAIGIVASTGCDYFAELGFPDTIEIGLATSRIGTSSITYRLGIFRAGDPALRALAHFVHVYVDAETRRPVPIPDVVRAAVETLPRVDS